MLSQKSNLRLIVKSVFLMITFTGCIAIPSSPVPRFYVLEAVKIGDSAPFSDVIVGVGPIKIAQYLDRPHMVTQHDDKTVQFSQFDRWSEPLDEGIARLLTANLTVLLTGGTFTQYPWNPSMDMRYQVVVNIIRIKSDFAKGMEMTVQWQIIDARNTRSLAIEDAVFNQPIIPPTYAGLAKALSTACASLSQAIANDLRNQGDDNENKIKDRKGLK